MDRSKQTALVTGANSGLGFEAAAQLAADGWGTVILACRSIDKAQTARSQLVERTGTDPFGVLALDTSEVASANAAAAELAEREVHIDFLLLNAGASAKDPSFNSDGVEITYASTLIGHHVLTMHAIADGTLTPKARVVIAGSEGARGNFPGMSIHDIQQIATDSFDGDLVAAIDALARIKAPTQTKFVNMNEYITAKLIVAWWAGGLSPKLPDGMTVNAVSPGAVAATGFARDAPAAMRLVMVPMMKLLGPMMRMNGSIDKGARRYLDAADFTDDQTGHFYATENRKKLVGPMSIQTWPEYFINERAQQAGFDAVVALTGVDFPAHLGQT